MAAANTNGATSNPNPPAKTQPTEASLGVQFNGNVMPYDNNPAVFNASPATKKSYPPK